MSDFDYDLFVIGAGSGGVRAARIAAEGGAHVAVAEEDKVGGTCVLRGCVPKKLFVTAAHFAEAFEDSVGFGWTTEAVRFDWARLRDNVLNDVEWLSGIYIRNLDRAGATVLKTRAVLEDAHTIHLLAENRRVTAANIIIATGGRPVRDPLTPGMEYTLTSTDMFHLERLPKRLLVVGGGYIAVEFAGVFNAFGVDTTLLYRGTEILRGFDDDIRKAVRAGMQLRGVTVHCGDVLTGIEKKGDIFVATTKNGATFEADVILSAIGRHPNTEGMGLDRGGVAVDIKGAVTVDEYLRTNVEHIFAVGDVTNRIQLTPVAIREGMAVVETIFGGRPTKIDYADIPTAVFSQPEVGTVGLTEEKARALYPSIDIYRTTFKPLPNRIAGREERMMMKLVVDAESDRVLGCHIVGPQAGEMAQLIGIAVKMKATKADFDATVALHPTMAEELVTLHRPTERYRRQAAE
jgi:glutathione reductase (NADPH)